MSDYTSLKATINANIRANGNQDITGPVLNSVLIQMVNQLGNDDIQVIASSDTRYNDNGSIYFGTISIVDHGNVTSYSIAQTISPIANTTTYFTLRNGSVSTHTYNNLQDGDIVLLVWSSNNVATGGYLLPDYVNKKSVAVRTEKTIQLPYEPGAYNGTGQFGANWYGKQYWRTPFIKCKDVGRLVIHTQNTGLQMARRYYNADYSFRSNVDYSNVTDGQVVTPPADACYMTFTIKNASATDIPMPKMTLTGHLDDNPFAFAPRPSNGYQRLIIPVNVVHPNASDTETSSVQDQEDLKADYGLIALPTNYDPNGAPIRMIIYCHGAGVNYASSISGFPTTDLLPEYWLSEGCAVMDIEGNPFNNTDEHFWMPQAIQCYLAAYDWCVKTYNIRRDGVYLGGRSMGGGMVFDILQSRIPVIAACPVVPAINELWAWEYMNAARRSFCANHMGFTGTAPTWTNNSPMSSAEWNYLQSNFDKVVKCAPFWRGIDSLPDKATLFGVGNTSAGGTNTAEQDLYNIQHFKAKAPVKMFAVHDDDTVNNSRNCDLMYQMMLNAAQRVEMRYFQSGGHHYELASQNLVAEWTNSLGVTLTNVPVTYIEMLQFWRRYELMQ